MRQDHYDAQVALHPYPEEAFDESIYPFITPFVPTYAGDDRKQRYWRDKGRTTDECDYTDEREWRVPGDLHFEPSDVAFVIVADRTGEEAALATTGGAINGKVLLMDNYDLIGTLWPSHQ
jgi:hypothetical protein